MSKRYNRRNKRSNTMDRSNNLDPLDDPEISDFREIPICPTINELIDTKESIIESNIIEGKYDSVDQYLDIQYKLLRQDFVRSLKKDINSYKSDKTKDLKVYKNVQIVEKFVRKKLRYFAIIRDKKLSQIDWQHSKRLIYGSLLCLSSNNFQTFCFASVVGDRKVINESENEFQIEIEVSFDVDSNESIDEQSEYEGSKDYRSIYVMIESEAYFEAYRHTLSALQTLNSDNFPLKRYIIEVNNEVLMPLYINDQTVYDFSHLIVSKQEPNNYNNETNALNSMSFEFEDNVYKRVNLLNANQWPKAEDMGFDDSQYEAFKTGLTKQLALIQGPPGCGKTYIGLKIVETLLMNRKVWNRRQMNPILIVCFTNHALDQFLEGILPFCQNLIRMGGRSQSEKLKNFIFNPRKRSVLQRKDIIGMTTTGAAKNRGILEQMASKIVVIEEAAEVLESHVITSLTKSTEHLILIGDHKQLRPNTADYGLKRTHNLDVSLFERMVLNEMPFIQLNLQHRMRPEISALLTPHIYEELLNNKNVYEYENIKGIQRNMFFITHTTHESNSLKSNFNEFEAEFVVRLAKHLLYQDYNEKQITILTLYSAQQTKVKELLTKNDISIDCQVLDGFQGEENDIILVSFVRSNANKNIGFLDVSNRVNVALSRAKKGLYCVGNFNLFSNRSKLWKNITKDLKKTKEIGPELKLKCFNHPNKEIKVKKAKDFDLKSPLGGCDSPCLLMLECGHSCALKTCHPFIEGPKCGENCLNKCPLNHLCPDVCHFPNDCKPCLKRIVKTVPICGHKIKEICSANMYCYKPCERPLNKCGHKCDNKCGEKCQSICSQFVTELLDNCGHTVRRRCCEPVFCYNSCDKILKCGHKCDNKCGEKCQTVCTEVVTELLDNCGHYITRRCCDSVICDNICQRLLKCGHKCNNKCEEKCQSICSQLVTELLPNCGHTIRRRCYEPVFCYNLCQTILKCGHKCDKKCGEECQTICNQSVAEDLDTCGHRIWRKCSAPVFCYLPCNKTLKCGHKCKLKCGDKCLDKCVTKDSIPLWFRHKFLKIEKLFK